MHYSDITYSKLELATQDGIKENANVEKTMSETRIEKLRQKKAQIDARIKGLESRERQQARKNETRKKIIAGALSLHHLAKNPDDAFSQKLLRLLDEYVTKPYERNLFGLPALPEESQNIAANDSGLEQGSLKESFKVEN